MIKLIEGLPENVVAVEVVGKVEADDYKNVLDPAVAKAVEAYGKVRILYVIGEEYESFSAGAMWQDAKVGVGERKDWERIAVVSDHNRMLEAINAFAWMIPGEARTYPMARLNDAKAWLSET